MKITLILINIFFAISSWAHEIEGVLVLKGSLTTDTVIQFQKAACKVRILEVGNLMEEDRFGNPAYRIEAEVELSAGDFFNKNKIRFNQKYILTNLHQDGVKDFEYLGSNINLKINNDGRLDEVIFLYKNDKVSCKF